MTTDQTDTSVVVIGGGQAGLSVSFYLKRLGLDPGNEFVVLDRGPGTGGAWQLRWEALRIGSAHRINDLPGMDALELSFENADRQAPAKHVVADYYRRYEEFYGFQVVRPAHVTRVENRGPNLAVTFTDGDREQSITTDIVINATGTWGSPFIPYYPGLNTFRGTHLHTNEYKDAAHYAGRKVVVVGGGTSAIGFLLELEHVASELAWVSRRPIDFLDEGELNLEARSSAVALQDEAARAGRALPSIVSGTGVPRTRRIQAGIDRGVLNARPMFSSIEPNGVRWADGSFQEADVILWSTGFRPELRHLAPLKLREKEGGFVVANGTAWKDPRVFFAGYGPQASTIGANRAGRTIARQAIATLSRIKREEREEREARDDALRAQYAHDAERIERERAEREAAEAALKASVAEALEAPSSFAEALEAPAPTSPRAETPETFADDFAAAFGADVEPADTDGVAAPVSAASDAPTDDTADDSAFNLDLFVIDQAHRDLAEYEEIDSDTSPREPGRRSSFAPPVFDLDSDSPEPIAFDLGGGTGGAPGNAPDDAHDDADTATDSDDAPGDSDTDDPNAPRVSRSSYVAPEPSADAPDWFSEN